MVLTLVRNKVEQKKRMLDVREAFNLWDSLKSNYDAIELLETYSKFVHDKDLIVLMNDQLRELQDENNALVDMMRQYSINGPDRGRAGSRWVGNPEALRDEFMFGELMIFVQEKAEKLLFASRTSLTNDEVRAFFYNALRRVLNRFDLVYKYARLKGWTERSPLYPNVSPDVQEKIGCSTVASLWDLLTFRYDNIRQTQVFYVFANDGDFKLILRIGLDTLIEQSSTLEQECERFGITLPKRPPEVIVPPEDTEVISDDHIFRTILSGIQGAGGIHIIALKQCVDNDRIRSMFKRMLEDDIGYYEKLVKYGKLKGWLHPAPAYRV